MELNFNVEIKENDQNKPDISIVVQRGEKEYAIDIKDGSITEVGKYETLQKSLGIEEGSLDAAKLQKLQELQIIINSDQSGQSTQQIYDILQLIEKADNVDFLKSLTPDILKLATDVNLLDAIADGLRRSAEKEKKEALDQNDGKKELEALFEQMPESGEDRPGMLKKAIDIIKDNPELQEILPKILEERSQNPGLHPERPEAKAQGQEQDQEAGRQ
ncbi:hypothetical protein N9X24_00780 [Rickettsiales bacterium]|nr:hypothetical protein [Rickettsiales bacterium]